MKCYPLLLILSLVAHTLYSQDSNHPASTVSYPNNIHTIAFGSCNHEDDNQSYWKSIKAFNPDIWIWLGDNIYGDTEDMSVLKAKYDMLLADSSYANFVADIPVIGTWDDHDYGANDGNALYSKKEESKALFKAFMNYGDQMNLDEHEGIYHSIQLGTSVSVNFILLDTRTFQDPLEKNPTGETRYLESDGDILGEEQWNWLEAALSKSNAHLTIIASSIQFIPDEHKYEKWSNFPESKKRMFRLLRKNPEKRCMFLSGDRHLAEISKLEVDGISYPLYEITSSGLTHSYEKANESNRHRISKLCGQKNFGIIEIKSEGGSISYVLKIMGIDGKIIDQIIIDSL